MCAFNSERFLPDALNSITAQTFTDFELIAVDDGSTDRTPALLAEAASRDQRIHIITNAKNLGLTRSLNTGLASVRGEMVVRMDSDDISLPQRVERQVAFMDSHPAIAAAGCWYELVGSEGEVISTVRPPTSAGEIKHAFLASAPVVHPGSIIRKSALEAVHGYDESYTYAQDRDLFLRLLATAPLGVVPEILLQLRISPQAIGIEKEMEQKRFAYKAVSRAISRGDYPAWRRIHLIRPWIAIHLPSPLLRFVKSIRTALGLRKSP